MRRYTVRSGLTLLAAALGLLTLGGCTSHTGPEPSYEGCANDENWVTFDDYIRSGKVVVDPQRSPLWLEPMPTPTALLPSHPPVFRFQPSPANAGTKNGDVSCAQFQPVRYGSGRTPLHLAPISGTVFDIHIDSEESPLYRILTTRQSASVPNDKWTSWAGKSITITLYEAQLANNDVQSGLFKTVVGNFQIGR